jgi:hypothetical protein
MGGERWEATTVATQANATLATGISSVVLPMVVSPSSEGEMRLSTGSASADDGGSQSSAVEGATVPPGTIAAVRVPGKQDRPKAQTEVKDAGTQTTAVVAVADQSKIPGANMFSWQGTSHGQGAEASEASAKNAAESSSGTQGKPVAPIDGTADGDLSMAIVAGGATGSVQGILTQAPVEGLDAGLDLPTTSGLATDSGLSVNEGGEQATGKSMQKDATTVDSAGNSKAADAVSNAKSAAGGVGDTSSHAAPSGASASQSSQGDLSKTGIGVVVSRATENGAAQAPMQTLLTHTVSHEGAAPQRSTSGTLDASHTGKAQELPAASHLAGGEPVATSGINAAKLIQTMGETEMHVGMHSEEFGDISIRTSVSQQQMITQISLDHSDLSQAISAHVSTLQAKLGEEYGLRASIQINNQGAPLAGDQGSSSQSEQRSFGRSSRAKSVAPAVLSESGSSVVALTSAGSGHGLDIRV